MAKCILLKETYPHADKQINLILQISSECGILQKDRTMLKNVVLITVFKRKVNNGVYILCIES